MPYDGDDTSAESLEDPYPARRRFFHVTRASAGITVFFAALGAAMAALGLFTFIAKSELDSRMLLERDWIDSHYVSASQETERIKSLDGRLQEVRETEIQVATMLHELQTQLIANARASGRR